MSDIALPIRSAPELALGARLSSDERLARLVSRGSERAFAALYQRHHQALYRYCRSIARDEDDAQDALQSAMMRAFQALRAGERDLAVRPWLFRIAHNEAVSILRRRRPDVSLVEELEPAGLGVERALEGRERLAMLVADIQALAERQRAALLMRELSGLSIVEIAAALSTSPGAVKQTLFEARGALHDFAEGRAMECDLVRRAISDGDRRVLRGRKLRGHLRECRGCRDFQGMIGARSADLRALAPPLPAAVAGAMLGRLLAHGAGGGHAGGVAVASGAVVGNPAAVSLTAKALTGVVIVAVAGAGGAHLALSPGPRGHTPPVVRQAAGSSAVSPSKGGRIASRSTTATGNGYGQTPLSVLAIPGAARGSTASALTGGSPAPAAQGHGGAPPSAGRGSLHRAHGGQSGSHRRGSSRPPSAGSGADKRAPAHPVKPRSRRDRARAEARERAAPARGAPATHEEASGNLQEHLASAGASSSAGYGLPAAPAASTPSG
jgi:RNA polymerase sigma factor (sigma-70 family)